MFKRLALLCFALAILGMTLPADAQQADQSTTASQANTTAARPASQPVSVKVDVTVTDQAGAATPTKKTVTLLAADGHMASVRSNSTQRNVGPNLTAEFAADARPSLVNDKVRLELTVRYSLPEASVSKAAESSTGSWSTFVTQSLTVVLDNGKPMIVSQSADPLTDRKVTVEVRATVLK